MLAGHYFFCKWYISKNVLAYAIKYFDYLENIQKWLHFWKKNM